MSLDKIENNSLSNALNASLCRASLYQNTTDYNVDTYSKGSDGEVYRCLVANGPSSSVVDPVGDATETGIPFRC